MVDYDHKMRTSLYRSYEINTVPTYLQKDCKFPFFVHLPVLSDKLRDRNLGMIQNNDILHNLFSVCMKSVKLLG